VPLANQDAAPVYLLGLDFLGSRLWQQQLPRESITLSDEIEFLAQIDSVAVPHSFAVQHGLAEGDAVRVLGPFGPSDLVIRGFIEDVPLTRLFDGQVFLLDLPVAQHLFGMGQKVDRIMIRLTAGSDPEAVARRIALALGGLYEVLPPEARGAQTAQLLFSLRTTLAIMSLGAVIVGAFIVYHTVAISLIQRRRHFALLNACGVPRRALIQLCLGETLVLAIPGVAVGMLMGRAVAMIASSIVGETVSEIWLRVDVDDVAPSMAGALVAMAVGLAASMASAYVAVRATFTASTVETLRPAGLVSHEYGSVWRPLSLGVGFSFAIWAIVLAPKDMGFVATVASIIGTQALGYVGIAVLASPVVWMAGTAARNVLAEVLPLPGCLAVENLPRNPGRSGGTVATITASMSIAVVVVTLVGSFERAWLGWVEQHFGGDLFIGSGPTVRLLAGTPMHSDLGDTIRDLDGVESVEPFRTMMVHLSERPVFLQGISIDDRLNHGGLPMVEGTFERAAEALTAGTGVLLSENLAYRLDLHRGDYLNLPTPLGPRRYRVEGTYVDYLGSLDQGAVAVPQAHLHEVWGDDLVNLFRVWLEPGVDASRVREQVSQALGGEQGAYFVLTSGEFLDGIRQVIRRFFAATWALEVVAALVGIIGVINTQLANVLDRTTEIGVLRTIGVSRRDIIRSVLLECGALGLLGGLLGVAFGLLLGSQIVLVSLRLVTGWRMPFVVPVWPLVFAVVMATAVSVLAGWWPARQAANLRLGQRSVD
jgi:putative ABC transport system permease protein